MQVAYVTDIAASQAIDLESWSRRPLIDRFREFTARVWGRLL
jgi:cardiolipin synthase A/B